MENIKNFLNKILPIVSIGIFIVWTLSLIFFSQIHPGEDVAHAWTIAANTNVLQLIDLMKVEGHFLIWYLCIMPFAKFPNLYPYAMSVINWIFCLSAIIYMWKKAPFHNFIKVCITFSVPFLQIYAIYPRCYSIGILFLFLAAGLYKDRIEKPFKYLICLILAANTSFVACIPAGIMGILFIYDIIEHYIKKPESINHKLNIFILLMIIFNLTLFYFQFWGVSIPDYETARKTIIAPYIKAYYGNIGGLFLTEKIRMILLWIGTIIFPIMFWKNKKVFIFFVCSEIITLLFFTFVYGARIYHTCFLFVFAILAFWMFKSVDNTKDKFEWKSIIFGILAFNMLFINIRHLDSPFQMAIKPILEDNELMSGKIYSNVPPITLSVLLPHIAKKGQTIYDMEGRDLSSYEGLKLYFTKGAKTMEPDSFAKNINSNYNNFILLNGSFKDNYILGKKYRFEIEYYKTIKDNFFNKYINIYKIKNLREI